MKISKSKLYSNESSSLFIKVHDIDSVSSNEVELTLSLFHKNTGALVPGELHKSYKMNLNNILKSWKEYKV